MRDAGSVRIKTNDDEFYAGDVTEYSRAGRDRQVRIEDPNLWQPDNGGYNDMGREDMLFMEEGMDRVLMRSKDGSMPEEDADDYESPDENEQEENNTEEEGDQAQIINNPDTDDEP